MSGDTQDQKEPCDATRDKLDTQTKGGGLEENLPEVNQRGGGMVYRVKASIMGVPCMKGAITTAC
jgi:hypothetical protein